MRGRAPIARFVRDQGPIMFFVLVTLGGMIFIWLAKLWSDDIWFVTLMPLGLMTAYFSMSLIASGLRLQNEQAGDNLYYMGFLFTLCSLGVSLYQFGGDSRIDDIVRNFGIAISSTIAGITLRIFFNQMRRDPIDIERSVRHELAEMTRKVRTELDTSAREFASYRRVSNQMLSEGFEEIARQAEKNGEQIQKAIEDLSKDAIKPIQDAAQAMATLLSANYEEIHKHAAASNLSVGDATKRLEDTTNTINFAVEGLGAAVDNLRNRLEELKSPEQSIQLKLQPALKSIERSVDAQIASINGLLELSKAHADSIQRVLAPITEMASTFKGSAELMNRASSANLENKGSIDRLIDRIDKMIELGVRTEAADVSRNPEVSQASWPVRSPMSDEPVMPVNAPIEPGEAQPSSSRWRWVTGR